MAEATGSKVDAEAVFVDQARLRQLENIPHPYYRVERRAGRAEIYATERVYREHLAADLEAVAIVCVLTCSGAILHALVYPSPAAVCILGILALVVAFVVWGSACGNMKAREDCRHPLVISGQGEVSYRGAVLIAAREVDYLQVRHSESADDSDYRVVAVTTAGERTELPTPHFGRFSDSGPPTVLAGHLALLLDRPLQDKVEMA